MKKLPHSILRTRKFQDLNQKNRLMWNLWFKWFTNVFIVPKEKCLPIRVLMPSNITWKPIIRIFSSKMNSWKKRNYRRLLNVYPVGNFSLQGRKNSSSISKINIKTKVNYILTYVSTSYFFKMNWVINYWKWSNILILIYYLDFVNSTF